MSNNRPNHNGFSIIEALITLAIATSGLLLLVDLFSSVADISTKNRLKAELNDVRNGTHMALNDPATCLENFKNVRVNRDRIDANDTTYMEPLPGIYEGQTIKPVVESGSYIEHMTPQVMVEAVKAFNWHEITPTSFSFDIDVSVSGGVTDAFKVLRVFLMVDPASPTTDKMVPTFCLAGARLAGVRNNCRVVKGPALTAPSQAVCFDTEDLVSGGGTCLLPDGTTWVDNTRDAEYGYLTDTRPIQVGTAFGWESDCQQYSSGSPDVVLSQAYALCCH